MGDKATPTQVHSALLNNITNRGVFKANPFKKSLLNKLSLDEVKLILNAFKGLEREIEEMENDIHKSKIVEQFESLSKKDKEDLLSRLSQK